MISNGNTQVPIMKTEAVGTTCLKAGLAGLGGDAKVAVRCTAAQKQRGHDVGTGSVEELNRVLESLQVGSGALRRS